jgi:arginase family enzyme
MMAEWHDQALEMFYEVVPRSDFLIWLSGNHLGVAPVLESLEIGTLIIQLDAHLDCYDLHDTHTTLSHGNFVRHLPDAVDIVNVGHRDLFLPAKSIKEHFTDAFAADEDGDKVIAALRKRVAKAKRVWLDIDADVFDPSVCPAVTTPAPFGLMPLQALKLIGAIDFAKLRGVSISEFEPGRDIKNASLDLLGWLLEWLLLRKYQA